MDLAQLQYDAHAIARAKGWWDTPTRSVLECLMLIVTEAAEAAECYRTDDMAVRYGASGKPEGIASELADIVIRVMDLAAHLGIDLNVAVVEKMAYNSTRSYRHGGKLA